MVNSMVNLSRKASIFHFDAMEQTRRTPRFPFSAPAELIRGDSRVSTMVTELSLYGCYLEAREPLARGTRVTVKIFASGEFFEAIATVMYSQPGEGMGLGFRAVKPAFLAVMQKWLRQALDKYNAPPTIHDVEPEKEM
jgi:hypothetical protein